MSCKLRSTVTAADAGLLLSILPPSWAAEQGGRGWFRASPHLSSITRDTIPWLLLMGSGTRGYYTAYVCWSSACSRCSNTKHFSVSLFCKTFYSGWSSTSFSYLCQAFQKLECGSKVLLIKELTKVMGSYKGIYYSPDNSVYKAHVPREFWIWHDSNPSSFITEALLLNSVLKRH